MNFVGMAIAALLYQKIVVQESGALLVNSVSTVDAKEFALSFALEGTIVWMGDASLSVVTSHY